MKVIEPHVSQILINLEFTELKDFLSDHHDLCNIEIGRDFLFQYDLSLFEYIYKSNLFKKKNQEIEMKEKFSVKDTRSFLESKNLMDNYVNVLMEKPKGNKLAFNKGEFIISDKGDSLMSKDGRILVHSHKGNIPKDILLNVSTVALLMLSGNIEYTRGYDYIKEILSVYGQTEFLFQMNGYLHIENGIVQKINYKSSTSISRNPKL